MDAFTGARVAAAVGAEVSVIECCFGRNALLSSAHVLAVGCVGAQFLSTCTCPDGSGEYSNKHHHLGAPWCCGAVGGSLIRFIDRVH